MDMNPTKAK